MKIIELNGEKWELKVTVANTRRILKKLISYGEELTDDDGLDFGAFIFFELLQQKDGKKPWENYIDLQEDLDIEEFNRVSAVAKDLWFGEDKQSGNVKKMKVV